MVIHTSIANYIDSLGVLLLAIFYPPLEIDLELCLAVFAGSGGNCLFHRIG